MYDQHVTREQQGETPAHLSAVNDAPQTDSEAGAERRDCEISIEDNGFAPVIDAAAVDAAASYVVREEGAVDEIDDGADDSDPYDEDSVEVPVTRAPEKPFLSVVTGFDQMFEEIEDQWQERALCAQTDPEAFFPEKGGSTREAKRICLGCEVKDECLEYALANDERFGIWGGLSERERRRLKRGIV